MATIIAMALITPMAMSDTPITVNVPNVPPEVVCKCESPNPVTPNMDPSVPVTVTICALVCDKNGKGDISSVTATVYNPDGTVKHDIVPMAEATTCECNLLEPVVSSTEPRCTRCDDPTCQLYKGTFQMDITQPGGEYRVVVTATDAGGLEDKLQNRFFFESIVAFDIDFTELLFTDIVICEPSFIEGDDIMEVPGPAPDVKPTIHNAGNDPIQIGFYYWFGGVNTIKMDVNTHWFEPDEEYWDGILEKYCDTMPLTFSLHVEEGTPGGSHTGYIEITAREAPHTVLLENKKTDDIYLYDPILGDGTYGTLTYDYDDCSFDFQGYGLGDPTQYCLIYYPEPWSGSGGCSFGPLSVDGKLSGILPCIPNAGDLSYDRAGYKLAKIWLVPCADYTDGVGLNKWNPSEILFDMETICCGGCCPQAG